MKRALLSSLQAILIAVTAAGCQQLVFVRDEGGVRKVFEMRADGSSQHRISPGGPTTYSYPDVSPDGQRITYTDGQRVLVSNLNDIGGSSQVAMTTGTGRKTFLKWSPDQLTIAYAQVGTGTQSPIFLANVLTGSNFLQVTFPTGSQSDGYGHDFYLNSAGAQYLVYSRDRQLFSMFFNGTQPATAITPPATAAQGATLPAVSPNNRLLAYRQFYTMGATGTRDLVQVVDVDTWQSRYGILPPAMIKQGSISAIAFSCDSKRVIVAAEPAAGPAGSREIYSANLNGSDWKRLTNNSVIDSLPNAVPRPCGFTLWPF